MSRYIFGSESVSPGHPDKLADQISDAVVDFCIRKDSKARVAVETLIGPGYIVVGGEVEAESDKVNLRDLLTPKQVRTLAEDVLNDVGCDDPRNYFKIDHFRLQLEIGSQSSEIGKKVNRSKKKVGAGDQGIMFGYACREGNKLLMPAPIFYADAIMRRHHELFKAGKLPGLRPDAKAMVWAEYRDGKFLRIDKVLVSTQHEANQLQKIRDLVKEEIVKPVLGKRGRYAIKVNPKGSFVKGGPEADTGLTGRKIVVDTYGGSAPHGGGAFSGKDPTKVDRSAAYAARWIAKHIVAADLASRCTVQLTFVIGETKPTLYVETHGTILVEGLTDERIKAAVERVFDPTPGRIIEDLELRRPIYLDTAKNGHFGRSKLSWERIDRSKVKKLQNAVS